MHLPVPRFRIACCGESSPPHVAVCLGRCLLLLKLHRLVEDGRQKEILTKLANFKKSIYVSSV